MDKKLFCVCLDNGHGINTPGKRSPDGTLREYSYAREIVNRIATSLRNQGYNVYIVTPETTDTKLTTRASRANTMCRKYGTKNCCFVSIHCNAAPPNDDRWHGARGWSVYTSKGRTNADTLATLLWKEANALLPADVRKYQRSDMRDGDPDYEENFTVLTKTNCAAVLTENLFQDNKEDVAFLLSEYGKNIITNIHVNAIKKYIAEK